MSGVNVTWRFDKANEANENGDRPVLFVLTTNAGPMASELRFVLSAEAADRFAGDLLNVLSGGIEIARAMPEGGTPL